MWVQLASIWPWACTAASCPGLSLTPRMTGPWHLTGNSYIVKQEWRGVKGAKGASTGQLSDACYRADTALGSGCLISDQVRYTLSPQEAYGPERRSVEVSKVSRRREQSMWIAKPGESDPTRVKISQVEGQDASSTYGMKSR